jgi:hypothetical protein
MPSSSDPDAKQQQQQQRQHPFYGQVACQGVFKRGGRCTNKAYWRCAGTNYYCGVHSGGRRASRTQLAKDPHATERRDQTHARWKRAALVAAERNRALGIRGDVRCGKMAMMRAPLPDDGYLMVFPNRRHQQRKDGFGCSELSPMSLGPVDAHHQRGLPPALTIENYHQFNKVFPNEVDADGGDPLPVFFAKQLEAYRDPEPHRHKYPRAELQRMADADGNGTQNPNAPLYSYHLDDEGRAHRYSYVESRMFYCVWMERLAKRTVAFARLRAMRDDGYNLQLMGYDGYAVTRPVDEHFADASRPFGHELVIYCLLTVDDPAHYPWTRYYWAHRDRYPMLRELVENK